MDVLDDILREKAPEFAVEFAGLVVQDPEKPLSVLQLQTVPRIRVEDDVRQVATAEGRDAHVKRDEKLPLTAALFCAQTLVKCTEFIGCDPVPFLAIGAHILASIAIALLFKFVDQLVPFHLGLYRKAVEKTTANMTAALKQRIKSRRVGIFCR
jgi:hypothetical protein